MPELIICDTSLLILFEKIKKLDLLRLCYKNIFITPEISAEFGKTLPPWIETKKVKNQTLISRGEFCNTFERQIFYCS